MPSGNSEELDRQYGSTRRLADRKSLHVKYGRPDWFPWLLEHAGLSPGMTCADIGCGMGDIWANMVDALPAGLHLTLLDRSPAMVEAALARMSEWPRLEKVEGHVGDAAGLPFPDASFDRVFAVHMLYHLEDPGLGVRELRRVTKPGGRVLAVLNGTGNMRELAELVASVLGGPGRDPSTLVFGAEQGEAVFRDTFDAVEVVPFEDALVCTDPEDVMDYIATLPNRTPSTNQVAQLRENLARAFRDQGGVFRISKDVRLLISTA